MLNLNQHLDIRKCILILIIENIYIFWGDMLFLIKKRIEAPYPHHSDLDPK
jgi:hypothetical protein